MDKNIQCSNVIESNNTQFETVYIITEEELANSFNLENQNAEIIEGGSFFIPQENLSGLDGQNIHLQNKENISGDNKLMPVILEKGINNGTMNNRESIPDQPEDNFNNMKVSSIENEKSFLDNSQPAVIDHNLDSVDQNIPMDHESSSFIHSKQNSVSDSNKDSSMVHDQKKNSDCHQIIQRKSSISLISTHASYVKLQGIDWDKFTCPYCERKFGTKSLMKKHMVRMHKFPAYKSAFACSYCDASFQEENLLKKHYEVVHKMLMTTVLAMAKDKRYPDSSEIPPNIKKGKRTKLSSEMPPKIVRTKSAPSSKSKICRIKCIECDINVLTFRNFREHLLKCHNLDVTEKEIRFPNMTAFKKWKLDIERRDLTFFTAQTGAKKLLNRIYRRYCCHRSGYRYTPGVNKNRMKNGIGSSKTGFFCTASMSVTEYPHEVHVKYCLQHYGHGGGITFGHLSNEQQAAIQENVLNGISLEEQLNDIKDTQSSAEHFQAQTLKKRDASFIDRAYASEVYNAGMNAIEYVEQWVRACSEMEDSPVLLYRHEGAGTKSEDLMLIIMTEFQKHILMTSTREVVCLAYPNRIKKGHNLLTALIVIDDQEVAFPVAFCISSKVNKSSMSEFLSSVKESTGPLSCSYFMSNDDEFFYEAWQEVMQDESKWVLSIWSIDDRIRKHLRQPKTAVKDINTRDAIYRLFRTILECNSKSVFSTMFKNYRNSLLDNVTTSDFGKYFVAEFDSNSEMWACCYRKDVKLSTDIFIEYLYKTMQYFVKITRTRQLDKFLMVLMKWLRCKMLDRLSNMLDEDKISLAKNTISMCHKMGLEIECENIVSLSDKIWLIKSQNEVDVYVTQEFESCPDLCDLRCPDCDVCVHMHSCSCVQSLIHANMCPHIHAVVWKFLTPHFSPPVSPEPDPCDDVADISADFQIIADEEPDLLKKVLKRTQGVYMQVRINKCKLNKGSLLEALRLLNRCYQICSCDEKPPHLLSESTQTEYNLVLNSNTEDNNLEFNSNIEDNLVSNSNIGSVRVMSSNRVLKDLDNSQSISYPSSTPVMELRSVLHPLRNSSNQTLDSCSASVPSPKPTSESVNNTVSNSSKRRKNIDAYLSKTSSNVFLNNRTLDSASERYGTDPLQATTNTLSTPFKGCKKFKLVPTAPLKTPLGCFLSSGPNSAVQNRERVNFIPVASSNNDSDKVGKIVILPSNLVLGSDTLSNSRPVDTKRHIKRTNVLDVSSIKYSSNISDNPVTSSPLIVKTAVSSSDILPVISAKTISNSVSPTSSVIPLTAAWVSVLKNHSELNANSANQVLSIIAPGASVNNVTNSVLKTSVVKPPTISKNHSEVKTNSTSQLLFIAAPGASASNVANSVSQTSVGKSTEVSDVTSKNHSEMKENSTDQVLFISVPDAAINNAANSVLKTPVEKPTAMSDSLSKNHSEVKSNSTIPTSVLQVPSVVKPSTKPVFILNNNFNSRTHSASEIFYIALPNASANIPSLGIKPNAPSVLTSNNNSNVTSHSAGQLIYGVLPHISLNSALNLGLQAPSDVTVPVSVSNNHSNVTSRSSSHLQLVPFPVASTNAESNFISHTSVKSSNISSDKSDKIRQIPMLSSNSISKSCYIERNSFSGAPLLKDSSNVSTDPETNSPFIVNTTVSRSDNLPAISLNTALNSVSHSEPVAKKRHIEGKDSLNVSSDSIRNSPLIVKTTASSSTNLPSVSVNDSASQGSSLIKPSALSVSTSNNDSVVATDFSDEVSCAEKIPDEKSNSSVLQLAASSSVKYCEGKSDASSVTNSILKPSSNLITSSTPNKQPESLQFLWEPVTKKRYVVSARIPFTPKSSQPSISSSDIELNSAS
ncbi:unnamed protein product [Larinioides sclopetarius]|uniref:C2H2-type domain-containing protein n=1 Tax=Larinioides sclopetarius TaxID=280406 RepID=A0AAV2AMR0_9ARAC